MEIVLGLLGVAVFVGGVLFLKNRNSKPKGSGGGGGGGGRGKDEQRH